MKKILAVLLAMVMIFSLAACGSKAEETAAAPAVEEKTEEIAETFTFKHGFDVDFPPYSYLGDDGEYTGFDVELCRAVCEYYGWGYEGVPVNWDAKDAELNSGSCDCIWSGFTINGREDQYAWSVAYSNNDQMILVPEGSDIKTLADLAGKLVGVQLSTSADDMLQGEKSELTATFADLKEFETYTLAFTDLKAGGIDAIAIDVTTGNFQMENNPDFPCRYLEEKMGVEQYGVGCRLEDKELAEQISTAIKALFADGTVDKIAEKYPEVAQYVSLGE